MEKWGREKEVNGEKSINEEIRRKKGGIKTGNKEWNEKRLFFLTTWGSDQVY